MMKISNEVAGRPLTLSALLASLNDGAKAYGGRADEAQMLAEQMTKGNNSMAEHMAIKIVERQRIIRDRSAGSVA